MSQLAPKCQDCKKKDCDNCIRVAVFCKKWETDGYVCPDYEECRKHNLFRYLPKISAVALDAITDAAKVEKSGWINSIYEGGIDGQPNKWQTAVEIVLDERNIVEDEFRERLTKKNNGRKHT